MWVYIVNADPTRRVVNSDGKFSDAHVPNTKTISKYVERF